MASSGGRGRSTGQTGNSVNEEQQGDTGGGIATSSRDPDRDNTHNGVGDKDGAAAAAAAHAEAVAASTAGGPSKDGPNAVSTSKQTSDASQQDKDGPGTSAPSEQTSDASQQDKDGPQGPQVVDSFTSAAGSVTTEQVAATSSDKDGDKDGDKDAS